MPWAVKGKQHQDYINIEPRNWDQNQDQEQHQDQDYRNWEISCSSEACF